MRFSLPSCFTSWLLEVRLSPQRRTHKQDLPIIVSCSRPSRFPGGGGTPGRALVSAVLGLWAPEVMKDYKGSCGFHLCYLEGTDLFRIKSIERKIVPRNGERKAILMGKKKVWSPGFSCFRAHSFHPAFPFWHKLVWVGFLPLVIKRLVTNTQFLIARKNCVTEGKETKHRAASLQFQHSGGKESHHKLEASLNAIVSSKPVCATLCGIHSQKYKVGGW